MTGIEIIGVGVHGREGPGFQIHRPRGSGDFVFLTFHQPIAVRFEYGQNLQYAGAGACILYTPGHLQWYWGVNAQRKPGVLDNSWVHFQMPRCHALLKRYGIATNTLVYPRHPEVLLHCLETLQAETLRRDRHWQRRAELTLQDLLLLAARQLQSEASTERDHAAEAFRKLRAEVHQSLTTRWTVTQMARRVHLSPSRFAAVYRHRFGVAPVDDLIDARLARARELLTNSTLPVKQVAAMSGFENIYYFSRIFRRRVGCAPREYAARVTLA